MNPGCTQEGKRFTTNYYMEPSAQAQWHTQLDCVGPVLYSATITATFGYNPHTAHTYGGAHDSTTLLCP